MASLLKGNLLLQMVFAAIFAFPLLSAPKAAEQIPLIIKGEKIKVLGRKHCTDGSQVEFGLSRELEKANDFEFVLKKVGETTDVSKTKGDAVCPGKLPSGQKIHGTFSKTDRTVLALDIMNAIGTSACAPTGVGVSSTLAICIYERGAEDLIAFNTFRVETGVAKIDSIEKIVAVNEEVSFEVKVSGNTSGTIRVEVCYGKESAGDIDADKDCSDSSKYRRYAKDGTSIKITGLEPVPYQFKVRLNNPKDGPTAWFTKFIEKPEPVSYPFASYKGEGGDVDFNCQQARGPGTLMMLIATLFGLLLLRRFRLKFFSNKACIFLLATSLLHNNDVHADAGQFSFGILGSMYRPDLDNEVLPDGSKVFPFYKCGFRRKTSEKDGPINPLMGGEFNVKLWDGFGSLELGLGLGYTFVTGHALKIDSSGNPDCDAPLTNVKSTLHMYQVRPQLTYYFDAWKESFPLIPYVRGALIGHGYIFRNGKSQPPNTVNALGTVKPNGFRFGYQVGVGLRLMLDFLEPETVASARGQGFVDHVYLQAELSYTKIDTFGRRGFQFSPKDIMGTRLPIMWTFGLGFDIP